MKSYFISHKKMSSSLFIMRKKFHLNKKKSFKDKRTVNDIRLSFVLVNCMMKRSITIQSSYFLKCCWNKRADTRVFTDVPINKKQFDCVQQVSYYEGGNNNKNPKPARFM